MFFWACSHEYRAVFSYSTIVGSCALPEIVSTDETSNER
jgi:hypothetical protein